MRKKIIKFSILSLTLFVIIFLTFSIFVNLNEKNKTEIIIQKFPFEFYNSLQNVPSYSDSMLIIFNYFHPACEHCQYMAQQFLQNKNLLKNKMILMFSNASEKENNMFKIQYHLDNVNNLFIFSDSTHLFYKTFHPNIVPSFFIYKKAALLKKINGETTIDNLLIYK